MKARAMEGLTCRELAELLLAQPDPDARVVFAYPSGDYWHTEIAGEVGSADEGFVEWSEYHNKWSTVDQDREPRDDDVPVVILS